MPARLRMAFFAHTHRLREFQGGLAPCHQFSDHSHNEAGTGAKLSSAINPFAVSAPGTF